MKSLSLCMIVKNEEKTLARALENARIFADEIIIVDTGSEDNTKQIAKQFTDKVYDYTWHDDFASARNFSFDRAKSEYIIWLDGDDFIPVEIAKKIQKWKEQEGEANVVECAYALVYDNLLNPTYKFLRERIVKNIPSLRWHDRVHEVIIPQGKIDVREDIIIYHGSQKSYTKRNLKIYQKMLAEGEKFTPRQMFYYARELFYHGYYKKSISQMKKFLKEREGFIENKIEACKILCYSYEMLQDREKGLECLFSSFHHAPPRGEVMYEIGRIFAQQKKYLQACFWFKLALENREDIYGGGFVDENKTTIYPALELVVCYYKLGDMNMSRHYHEVAKAFSPNNECVKYNEKFFNNN